MALDWGILHWIQNNISCPFLDAVVPKLTMLGNAGIIWILAGVLLLCTKKYRRQGALVLMGLLAGLLVGNVALKHLVARSRPCWLDPSVQLLIATPTDYSFPSGHTLSSTIAATILTKTDRRFGYVAIPLAVLIALSRLYLYVHFPSDVFAAALLGLLIGELTFRYGGKLLDKISRRQKQKRTPAPRLKTVCGVFTFWAFIPFSPQGTNSAARERDSPAPAPRTPRR